MIVIFVNHMFYHILPLIQKGKCKIMIIFVDRPHIRQLIHHKQSSLVIGI